MFGNWDVGVFGHVFKSSEHAYQWRKCIDCLRPDLAHKITRASTPKRAKQIASSICESELVKWHDVRGHIFVMKEVLLGKTMSNIDFCEAIMKSREKLLVESTRDCVWELGCWCFRSCVQVI